MRRLIVGERVAVADLQAGAELDRRRRTNLRVRE